MISGSASNRLGLCPLRPYDRGTERALQNLGVIAGFAFVVAARLLGGQLFVSSSIEETRIHPSSLPRQIPTPPCDTMIGLKLKDVSHFG